MSTSKLEKKDLNLFISALSFAAEKHKDQKRKGRNPPPYINHSIKVAKLLSEVGEVQDCELLIAALLHDTIEDTHTLASEIEFLFGKRVATIVLEVTNDNSLNKTALKQSQIDKIPKLSSEAKLLKLADVTCNIQDVISFCPPLHWSKKRRMAYLLWGEEMVNALRGTNQALENLFDKWLEKGKSSLEVST